jgi:hypothetical protein
VLCCSGEFIAKARRMRKVLGGGMRQAGVIAAAGIYAMEHMVDRLQDDHENARILARGLAELPGSDLDPTSIETNIVIFKMEDAAGFARRLKQAGVLCTSPGHGRLRMVTHYGIERADIEDALERAGTSRRPRMKSDDAALIAAALAPARPCLRCRRRRRKDSVVASILVAPEATATSLEDEGSRARASGVTPEDGRLLMQAFSDVRGT